MKRVHPLAENVVAADVELTADQIDRLDDLVPAASGHDSEAQARRSAR